ncbi:unnamed protein product [Caenorhabditis brenneri]
MAETPTHPLFNLPDDEIIQKLREMNLKEVLKFSLISEKSKELVKSTKIKGTYLSIRIERDIQISIQTQTQNPTPKLRTSSRDVDLTFYREQDMYWGMGAYGRKKKLTDAQSVLIKVTHYDDRSEDTISELEKRDFTIQDWLDHLQQIFDRRRIDFISFTNNSSQFDMDDIKKVFGTARSVEIENTGCYAFNQMILDFFPIEEIHIKNFSFPNSKVPEKVLIQNFIGLHIGEIDETTPMTLDELQLINSKNIHIVGLQLPAKQFNKFIKLWQNGSNPQMEYLTISYPRSREWVNNRAIDEEFDAKVFMKGIEHRVISRDTYRSFKEAGNSYPERMNGGMDILRKDGVKATIQKKTFPVPEWSIFGISLVSKKSKCLVQSLKIRASKFIVCINYGFSISLEFSESVPNRLEFSVVYDGIAYRWALNAIGRSSILDHLKFIFNVEKIKVDFETNDNRLFDFEPILEGRLDIESINVETDNQSDDQRILDVMKPSNVSINKLPSDVFLVQNIDSLDAGVIDINLNELLMVNSRNFVAFSSSVTSKLLNQFLKLWLHGSNPQLESLKLNFPIYDDFLEEDVFDRLKVTGNRTVRYFKSSASRARRVTGGIDIVRFDGTIATIFVKELIWTVWEFEMLIWHDHCIATENSY